MIGFGRLARQQLLLPVSPGDFGRLAAGTKQLRVTVGRITMRRIVQSSSVTTVGGLEFEFATPRGLSAVSRCGEFVVDQIRDSVAVGG